MGTDEFALGSSSGGSCRTAVVVAISAVVIVPSISSVSTKTSIATVPAVATISAEVGLSGNEILGKANVVSTGREQRKGEYFTSVLGLGAGDAAAKAARARVMSETLSFMLITVEVK